MAALAYASSFVSSFFPMWLANQVKTSMRHTEGPWEQLKKKAGSKSRKSRSHKVYIYIYTYALKTHEGLEKEPRS